MKISTKILLAIALLIPALSFAQVTTLSTDSITCSNSCTHLIAGSVTPAGTNVVIADDQYASASTPIGFNFTFYGVTYNKCVIGSNGNITFDSTLVNGYDPYVLTGGVGSTTSAIPGNSGLKNSIAAAYCDMYDPSGGTISYMTIGSAPNRRFVVTYCGIALYSCYTNYVTSQIVLFEDSNKIEVNVARKDTCSWNGGFAIVGVESEDSSVATAAPGRNVPTVWSVSTGESWKFKPDGSSSYVVSSIPYAFVPVSNVPVTWTDMTTGTVVATGDTVQVCPRQTTTYQAAVYGCTDTTYGYCTVTTSYFAGDIAGPSVVCVGSTVTMTDTSTGGTWSVSNANASINAATGELTGVVSGPDTVTYTPASGCSASRTIYVAALPVVYAGADTSECLGSSVTLIASGASTYEWSPFDNLSCSACDTTTVTASATATYTVVGTSIYGCTASDSVVVTVKTTPPLSPISGPSGVCVGSTITLTDTATGVTWSSYNSSVASIGASTGVVVPTTTGTDTIIAKKTNVCGTDTVFKVITVGNVSITTVTNDTVICQGNTVGYIDYSATTGGLSSYNITWGTSAISAGFVNVSSAAFTPSPLTYPIPAGVAAGTYSGYLTVSNGSCTGSGHTISVTVHTTPVLTLGASPIVVQGTSPALLPYTATGSPTFYSIFWSSEALSNGFSNVSLSSLPASPISITVPSSAPVGVDSGRIIVDNANCASTSDTFRITIIHADRPPVFVDGVNQNITVCENITGFNLDTVLAVADSDAGQTETWTVATSPAHGTLSGFPRTGSSTTDTVMPASLSYTPVTGYSGADSFTIRVSDGTDSAYTHVHVTVNPLPNAGTISGGSTVCVGANLTLSESATGGTWGANNDNVNVIGGVVTGVTSGTSIISYTVTNTCGSTVATKTITINSTASAGVITSTTDSVCVLSSITLSDTASGGTWSASNSKASVSGGIVTGLSIGLDTISYGVPSSCGTTYATKVISVLSVPSAGLIFGSSSVCAGATITVTDTTSNGVWSATNATATVSGGIINGVTAGIDTIKYTVTNICGVSSASKIETIKPAANAGVINGSSVACMGSSLTLTDTASGGTWSSSNAHALVTAGVITPVSLGADTISYIVTNTCGTSTATKVITVSPLPDAGVISGLSAVCAGTSITLTDTTSGGSWSAGSSNATVSGGVVTGVTAGPVTISYSYTNGCGTSVATHAVTVNPQPNAGIISGATSVCVLSTTTLHDTASGGTWSASNSSATIAGGVLTGAAAGVDTINYTVTNTCGTAVAVWTDTVNANPNAGAISGSNTVCAGANLTLSDAATGGAWSSSNAHATVAGGVVTGVSAGADTIRYTVTNSCGTASAIKIITVNPLPAPGTISGASTVCVLSAITLTDTSSGGTWSASNSTATVAGGIVTGISAGLDTISYSVTNSCGIAAATKVVTINANPDAGVISGGTSVCAGSNITLSSTVAGGTWTARNAKASVNSGGIVTGITVGQDTLIYSVTNSCGTAKDTVMLTVSPLPVAGAITGASAVCQSGTIFLSDTATGGVWGAANSNASVTSGAVTGTAGGTDTITYSVTNSCGTAVATHVVTISPLPDPGVITGSNFVCISAAITLTESVTGGSWSASNGSATVLSSGVVGGVSVGADTIIYSKTNSCGTSTATHIVNVNSVVEASSITGASSVCVGANTSLSDSTTGGTWASSNNTVATVSSSGVVHGVNSGSVTISYIYLSSCGSFVVTNPMSVIATPNAGTITGSNSVCVAASVSLSDGTAGGTWSISNTSASITSGGIVTGASVGLDTVSYTVTNSCGTAVASFPVSVNPLANAGAISGVNTVCQGATSSLAESATGGSWSSNNSSIASVNTSGVVTGVTSGSAIISYTVTNSCGTAIALDTVTVNPAPSAGTISGPSGVCMGATITLTDGSSGGTWTSGNTAVATVDAGGVITPVAIGSAVISYTVTNSCGTATATAPVVVSPLPNAGSITGASNVCTGANITLSDTTSGGAWSSASTSVATISPSGVVTGVTAGTAVISYTSVTACGTLAAIHSVTVSASPNAGSITGPSSVCTGADITLSDASSGGTWNSSNTSVASIDATTGVVTGVDTGSTVVSYTVTTGCGSATTTRTISSGVLPDPGTIGGITTTCQSTTTTLTETVGGGVWSSANPAIATVNASGVVTGVAGGSVVISYSIAGACAPTAATTPVTINPFPYAGVVTGASTVCQGFTTTLTDTVSGGTWSSGDTSIATVNSSGVVTGVAGGLANIYYSVSNTCGATNATVSLTVSTAPAPGMITGTTSVCPGSTTSLSETVGGGAWSSSNTSLATVDASTGVVTGVANGIDTITYTLHNTCGFTTVTTPLVVNPFGGPGVITGTTVLCPGNTSTLADTAGGGAGAWSIANPAVATIDASGVVTAVATGTTTVSYTVINGCGSETATAPITVNAVASAGTISGATSICITLSSTLSSSVPGGTWTSDNGAIASVIASGVVTANAAGTANITYSVVTSCGSASTSVPVHVTTSPDEGLIVGSTSLCQDNATTFTETTAGGSWSSSDTSIATVNSGGVVSGVSFGLVIISYEVNNGCGLAVATADIVVEPAPDAGTLSGVSSICAGTQTTLTSTASGGTWSSGNIAAATVNASGIVTGVAAGSATITYTSTTTCGTLYATHDILVNPQPNAGAITGLTSVCQGNSLTLSDTAVGGTWSSSNIPVATVSGMGVVNGVAVGTATISYSISNMCGVAVATAFVTVNPLANAGSVSGSSFICSGNTTTMTETVTGGTWTSSNAAIASVNSGGIVTGNSAGAAIISYTVVNSCSTVSAIAAINVGAAPGAGVISGLTTVCPGASASLSDSVAGGTWTTSDPSIVSISSTGIITGANSGAATVSYTVANTCGSGSAIAGITVLPGTNAGSITGTTTTVCAGSSISLSDTVMGGTWSSSDTAVAGVSTMGVVSGMAAGTANISYTVSGTCGNASVITMVTVNPLPAISAISGPTSICVGNPSTLTDATFGGAWSSSNASIASINAVTGGINTTGAGNVTFIYSITDVFGCTSSADYIDTINAAPDAGTISASATTLCPGTTLSFTDAATGGVWSSSDPGVASTDASGNVTGVASGTAVISYSITNLAGCMSSAVAGITVNPSPSTASISGSGAVCVASATTLSDAVFGGSWSSSDPTVATIDATTGVLTGVTPGVTTISYSVTNIFGCSAVVTATDTVVAPPVVAAIAGSGSVCIGSSVELSDSTSGGVWTSSDVTIATADASGNVHGVAAGSAMITYMVTNGLGCTSAVVMPLTVNPLPVVNAIDPLTSVCPGGTTAATDATMGGVWSGGDTTIATINAATGVISAIGSGVTSFTYTYTNAAGCSASVVGSYSVNPEPVVDTIAGSTSMCPSTTTTLSDFVVGGSWSSASPSVASIDASGVVTSLAMGTDTVYYTVTNTFGCSTTVFTIVSVVAPPAVDTISGPMSICAGSAVSLADATAGGIWSSSDGSIATVDATTGVVTGMMAGSASVSYTVSSGVGCTTTVSSGITVNGVPMLDALSGVTSVCPGATASLISDMPGGTWSSSNVSVSTVGATTGLVTGVAAGVDTIYYTVTNAFGCSSSIGIADTVITPPAVAAITGAANVCVGNQITLSDAITGGNWSSSSYLLASVDASGVVNGIAAGPVGISYTVTDAVTGCSSTATMAVEVDTLPVPAAISGATSICIGSVVSLSGDAGGVWSSSDTTIVSVGAATGVITGNAIGSALVANTITNAFGCSNSAYATINVVASPVVDAITGSSDGCVGSTVLLSDATPGGAWSSSDTTVATVSTAGVVTAAGGGTATIIYTVDISAGCSTTASILFTTDTLPAMSLAPATGSGTICHGSPVVVAVLSSATGLSYQWYRNGNVVAGAVSASYAADTAGIYTVTVSSGICSEILSSVSVLNAPHPVISHGAGSILYTGSFSTYQWLHNGLPITGATSSVYNAVATGTYNVIVTDGNGCADTSAGYVVSGGSSIVQNVNTGVDVSIFPNPATDQLTVQASVKVNIAIVGMDGKVVLEQNDASTIDIASLPSAVYMIVVFDEHGAMLKKDKFTKAE